MDETDGLRLDSLVPRRIWRIEAAEDGGGTWTEQAIEMVVEEPLALEVNGQPIAVLMRLPGMEKELAAGFLVSEGVVAHFRDVYIVHHCGQGLPSPLEGEASSQGAEPALPGEPPAVLPLPTARNRVEVTVRAEALRPEARLEVVRLIRAGCGAVDVARAELTLPTLAAGPYVGYPVFWGMERSMRQGQRLHQQTGGVHAAALFDLGGALVTLCEDVGRHNALDKAIGYCLLRGIPLHDKILLSSGRLSYEMATKALRVGLPILASASAPTALAVQLAERYNLTIVGYLRGRRMSVYTHPERLRLP